MAGPQDPQHPPKTPPVSKTPQDPATPPPTRPQVFAVTCGRCQRKEYTSAPKPRPFSVEFLERSIRYDDLCDNCVKILTTALGHIEPLRKASPRREG